MTLQAIDPRLRDDWSTWLSAEPWDAFLTVTHDANDTLRRGKPKLLTEESRIWRPPRKAHPEQVLKRIYYCRQLFNNARYGRNWLRHDHDAMSAVIGIERHASYSAHAHALLRIPGGITLEECATWQKLFTDTGGFCKLEIPREQAEVTSYVTKYVVKHGGLDITPNWTPTRAQMSLDTV